jgi:enterochelin esterase-like enzyme
MRLRLLPCFALAVFVLATGCTPLTTPPSDELVMITAAATAVAPIPTATPITLPPTPPITPSATPANTPTATSTATPTATATASPTPTPTPCAQPGRIETGIIASPLDEDFSYRIYLPPCYGADGRSYPTLYLLPGNTYTDALWQIIGIDKAAETGILAGQYPPLLIVMPFSGPVANFTSGGPGSYETLILDDVIPYIEATYCAIPDPAYRALGGVSRGGYWALEIAFRHPEQFVSVGGHSAALLDEYAGPTVNPQVTALTNDLGDLRIYLDIGRNDWVRANTLQLHEDMAAAGIPHDWFLNDGVHEEAYWTAHLDDYLTWYTAPWNAPRDQLPLCPLLPQS